ncbi:MAG TPA: DUF559 domain-containing protein [Burkholderiales bacterium]|jgi:very-short-patch-repair endonuclease|nr:DUF559 domain-containing protein [Burkholderiales bacterium]
MRARQRKPRGQSFDELYAAADARRLQPTASEAALERILNELGQGALRGEFRREWPFEGWFLDFYFPAPGLAIEVDGGYHRIQARWREDQLKAAALAARGITLLRLSDREVLGDRERLVQRLRNAWREALRKQRATGVREQRAAYVVQREAGLASRLSRRPTCRTYIPGSMASG